MTTNSENYEIHKLKVLEGSDALIAPPSRPNKTQGPMAFILTIKTLQQYVDKKNSTLPTSIYEFFAGVQDKCLDNLSLQQTLDTKLKHINSKIEANKSCEALQNALQ